MKTILITGGAGHGSMLCTELVKNYNIIVLDKLEYNRNSLNHLMKYENFSFHKMNILDKKILKFIKSRYHSTCSTSRCTCVRKIKN